MKIRISVPSPQYEEVKNELEKHGIEVSDDAELVLMSADEYPDWIAVRLEKEHMHIPVSSIIFIESIGHDVLVHTDTQTYQSTERLTALENLLDPSKFLRISSSVIIARKHVVKIKAAFTQKFILTLSEGSQVDVTRSYYYIFRKEFGI